MGLLPLLSLYTISPTPADSGLRFDTALHSICADKTRENEIISTIL